MSQESTIRRGVRNARYAAIPNHVFEDTRLSMEARWLLSYLLSKPDNWTVVIGDICKRGNCGRDKARGMIAELVKLGYAEREQQRADGKFGASVLVIFDEPRDLQPADNVPESQSVAFLPQTDLPATAMPAPAPPSPAKSALSNNSYLANTDYQDLREGVRELSKEERKAIELRFWKLVKDWPASEGMPKSQWLREWLALTDEERDRAERRKGVWLAKLKEQRKSHVPAPSTYFREKLFDDVADPQAAAKPRYAAAAAFGKLWGATRFADLFRSPYGQIAGLTATERNMVAQGLANEAELMRDKVRKSGWSVVNRMHEKARAGEASFCPTSLEDIASGFVPVLRGGDIWQAWADEHERRGWPWLDDTRPMERVYFPPIDPTLPLDAAVRAALDNFAGAVADIQKGKTHDAA